VQQKLDKKAEGTWKKQGAKQDRGNLSYGRGKVKMAKKTDENKPLRDEVE
jgi:hypothetical protein